MNPAPGFRQCGSPGLGIEAAGAGERPPVPH